MRFLSTIAAIAALAASPAYADGGQKVAYDEKGQPQIVTSLGTGIYGDSSGNVFVRDQPGVLVDVKTGERRLIQGTDLETKLNEMERRPVEGQKRIFDVFAEIHSEAKFAAQRGDKIKAETKAKLAAQLYERNKKEMFNTSITADYISWHIGLNYQLLAGYALEKGDLDSAIVYEEKARSHFIGPTYQPERRVAEKFLEETRAKKAKKQ